MNLIILFYVVENTLFQALLRRLFFALTECETKDYEDRSQVLTLTDSRDPEQKCKVLTGERKAGRGGKSEGFMKEDVK